MDITETQWKQFIEGIARGLVGPFAWVNRVDGDDSIREYKNRDVVVASMRVVDDLRTDRPGESVRVYNADRDLVAACKNICILTDAEWAEFDDFDGDDEAWLAERGVL